MSIAPRIARQQRVNGKAKLGATPRQLRTATAILAAFSAIYLAHVEAAPRPSKPRVKTLLVLGDSLSDGFRLRRSEAYPALLTAKLREAGLAYQVTNASVSGGTTAGGVQRISRHLGRKTDILILQLGINDAFRLVPTEQIEKNLQTIIELARKRSPALEVVIVGMQLPNHSTDDYVSAFGRLYGEVAEKNNAALVPYLLAGVGGDPLLNLPDRIHPNAAGQRVLAENVWKVLEPIARQVAER